LPTPALTSLVPSELPRPATDLSAFTDVLAPYQDDAFMPSAKRSGTARRAPNAALAAARN
jgi:hypothetical protein